MMLRWPSCAGSSVYWLGSVRRGFGITPKLAATRRSTRALSKLPATISVALSGW